ncbi:unnamed protein product [Cuscuta epithymum]|uniref:Uncharacterized protein n=1 Tax=Cuscuta epithymum TaxID=186058 RepID=A0AAV0DBC1_9ASTE|nr:unnamed protein product [Cuscuta epithymum]
MSWESNQSMVCVIRLLNCWRLAKEVPLGGFLGLVKLVQLLGAGADPGSFVIGGTPKDRERKKSYNYKLTSKLFEITWY